MGFLTSLFEKRDLPLSQATSGSWLYDLWTGGKTASGQSVNEFRAMQQATVYACQRIIGETIASLECRVYKKSSNGSKELAVKHPLWSVVHHKPNTEIPAFNFWETMVHHLLSYGNAYAEIVRDGNGKIVELWPLLPDQTTLERNPKTLMLCYRTIIPTTNEQVVLPFEKVLHIAGLGYDGRQGYSPIQLMRETLGLTLSLEEYGARYFGNGAKPGGVIEHPGNLSEPAQNNLRSSWNEMHEGLSNSHRIAILEEGMKYHQLGLAPEDSQFLESRSFQKREIAQIYRVPPHMIGDLEKASFASMEQQSLEFVQNCIRPWLERIEQAIRFKCIADIEMDKIIVEFNVNSILRGDSKTRNEVLQIKRQNGVITANEWREAEGDNPSDDEAADKLLVNSAMVAVNAVINPIDQSPKGGEGEDGQQGKTKSNTSTGDSGEE
ncbi:phage portal protein [Arthrobacter citreus]|nr:phage portal protein [Arthrobacter citreus]